jgi:hypothetical protein
MEKIITKKTTEKNAKVGINSSKTKQLHLYIRTQK